MNTDQKTTKQDFPAAKDAVSKLVASKADATAFSASVGKFYNKV